MLPFLTDEPATRLTTSEKSCSRAFADEDDEPRRLSFDFLGTRRFRDVSPFLVGFGAIGTGDASEASHGATWLTCSVGWAWQGVAVVKQIVGICGLDEGVANGDGDCERAVSVVGRESSCKGISQYKKKVVKYVQR